MKIILKSICSYSRLDINHPVYTVYTPAHCNNSKTQEKRIVISTIDDHLKENSILSSLTLMTFIHCIQTPIRMHGLNCHVDFNIVTPSLKVKFMDLNM